MTFGDREGHHQLCVLSNAVVHMQLCSNLALSPTSGQSSIAQFLVFKFVQLRIYCSVVCLTAIRDVDSTGAGGRRPCNNFFTFYIYSFISPSQHGSIEVKNKKN